jgi:hypothetical protein
VRAVIALVLVAGTARADKIVDIPELQVQGVPEPPPPAPEVAALGKQLAGKWTCKGTEHLAGGLTREVTAKVAIQLALGDAWVRYSTTDAGNLKRETFRTFDSTGKQWTQVEVTARGRSAVSTSLGPDHDAWKWQGADFSIRDREVLSGKKLELAREGLDGGKWQPIYELTCSKL